MGTDAVALGKVFNLGFGGIGDADASGLTTGKRHYMGDAECCSIIAIFAAGTASDDVQMDVQQHDAASGGNTKDLDIVTTYFKKQEATLDNDEVWARVTQAEASEVNGDGTSAEEQEIYCIEVRPAQLDMANNYNYISLNVPDLGSAGAKQAVIIYLNTGLKVRRAPENLPACLR